MDACLTMTETRPMPTLQLWTIGDVQSRLQISRRKIYYMIDKGDFPRPIKIGWSLRWEASQIAAWLKDKTEITETEDDFDVED